jgi:hypothetical protein
LIKTESNRKWSPLLFFVFVNTIVAVRVFPVIAGPLMVRSIVEASCCTHIPC